MTINVPQIRPELDEIARRLGALDAAQGALVHAVRKAREAGRSWSEIAEPLGVTKQAAQQRFGD